MWLGVLIGLVLLILHLPLSFALIIFTMVEVIAEIIHASQIGYVFVFFLNQARCWYSVRHKFCPVWTVLFVLHTQSARCSNRTKRSSSSLKYPVPGNTRSMPRGGHHSPAQRMCLSAMKIDACGFRAEGELELVMPGRS